MAVRSPWESTEVVCVWKHTHISQQEKVVVKSLNTTGSFQALTGYDGAGYATLVSTTQLGRWRGMECLNPLRFSGWVTAFLRPTSLDSATCTLTMLKNVGQIIQLVQPQGTKPWGSFGGVGAGWRLLTNCPEPVGNSETSQCFLSTLQIAA